jgi:hypothetical protein
MKANSESLREPTNAWRSGHGLIGHTDAPARLRPRSVAGRYYVAQFPVFSVQNRAVRLPGHIIFSDTYKRILQQALLHQHRQSHGTLPHVGHTAGKVNPTTRRQRDHQSPSALRTRRKARPSTAASTRTKTPLRSTISITPSGRDGGAGTAGAGPVTTLTWPPRTCWRHEYSRPLLIAYLRATSVGVSAEPRLSATIARFCSGVQVRRRSRARTATRPRPVPLTSYRTDVLFIDVHNPRRQCFHGRLRSQSGSKPQHRRRHTGYRSS